MTNVINFKARAKSTPTMDGPANSAFCCPTCETCFFHLRMDWKAECQNGHLFDWLEWTILDPEIKHD